MKQPLPFLSNCLWLIFGFLITLMCWLGPLLILGGFFVLISSASRDAKIKTASMFFGVFLGYATFLYLDAQGMVGWK